MDAKTALGDDGVPEPLQREAQAPDEALSFHLRSPLTSSITIHQPSAQAAPAAQPAKTSVGQ
ncbi:hypothetical protein C664_06443 [Thauera sp. 63]|nr:hypothetical protein C664_06443 [Thauera sp. 63]